MPARRCRASPKTKKPGSAYAHTEPQMKLGRTVALRVRVTPDATARSLPESEPADDRESIIDFGGRPVRCASVEARSSAPLLLTTAPLAGNAICSCCAHLNLILWENATISFGRRRATTRMRSAL